MRRASERPIPDDELTAADLREIWSILSLDERVQGFRVLPRDEAESLLFTLADSDLTKLVLALKPGANEVSFPADAAVDGVLRVTVFEEEGDAWRPAAERLIFRRPARRLALEVETDRKSYRPGDRVTLLVAMAMV